MKSSTKFQLLAGLLFALTMNLRAADPLVDSWLTTYSGKYARIYTTDANKTNGVAVSTWSNGSQTQSLPAYAGVQEIYSSASWLYVRSTGLGAHVMGPWYLNAAHTMAFPNYPVNQKTLWRFPRTNTIPGTKTQTGLGTIGLFVDGVAMFDSSDGFVWTGSAESGNGTGYWHREAYANEGVTFDPGYAHQEQTGTHHYHANPFALRYLLGDHVDFNSTTKIYSESTNAVTKHSPILGWVRDGLPIYGPYGYSNALDSASGVRRMVSGFQLRNGVNGTDNLTTAGRGTIPAWAQRLYNVGAAQSGPAVSTTYPIARYMEDYAYLGDLTNSATGTNFQQGVEFDLNEYNVRYCVTPEFPGGTYAYFVSIETNGTPKYPNNIGRAFFGSPTGSSQTSIGETVTTNYIGGASNTLTINPPIVGSSTVTLSWSSVEGGTYVIESSTNFPVWSNKLSNVVAQQGVTTQTNFTRISGHEFYRVARTALANYDPVSGAGGGGGGNTSVVPGGSSNRGTNVTVTITLPGTPPSPPANAPITSVTLAGTIYGSNTTYAVQGTVITTFTIPTNAPTGAQNVVVTFNIPVFTFTGGFTINP